MDALTHDQWLTIAIVFSGIFGLIIGSFLNVLIWRIPNNLSISRPGSHCPKCKESIKPYDNIPIVSYLILRGKCRHCHAHISFRYPGIELLTAIVWVVTTWTLGLHIHTLGYLLFFSGLIALSAIDIDTKLLPKKLVYPSGAILAIFLAASSVKTHEYNRLVDAIIVACVYSAFLFIVWFATAGKAMGFGDVRLASFLGLAMGYYGFIVSYAGLLVSFALGAVIGLAIAVVTRSGRKMKIPFGPFLATGTMIVVWCAPLFHDLVPRTHV